MNFGTLTSGGAAIVLGETTFAGAGGTGSGKLSGTSLVVTLSAGGTINLTTTSASSRVV